MKVAVITGSRADWNGLGMVAKCLRNDYHAAVSVIAIGQHAETGFGEASISTIIDDGFDPILAATNYKEDMAHGLGRAAISIANALDGLMPDMALVLGDRFEIAGAAAAVSLRGIPLAHIGGGDITEGSIDNKLRYAISAVADLHFVTNQTAYDRLLPALTGDLIAGMHWPLHCTGNPALDRIAITPRMNRDSLFKRLGLKESKRNILVVFHAVTAEADPSEGCSAMLDALKALDNASFFVLGTNSDTGSRKIAELLSLFAITNSTRCFLRSNLPPEDFYGCLQHFDCMIGNSSAGIVETAGFGIPVVNIGTRQKGRPYPQNVTHCKPTIDDIEPSIKYALRGRYQSQPNPYGDGHSAPRIAKIMVGHINARSRP